MIKARLRKRDKDIKDAISRLNPQEVQLSAIVREGARIVLGRLGVMNTEDDIETAIERSSCDGETTECS